MITNIHHIAFFVDNMDESVHYFQKVLGLKFLGKDTLEYRGVEVGLFKVGEVIIELIAPYKEGPPMELYRLRGNGFFHMAFQVEDIKKSLNEIKGKGVKTKDNSHRQGLNNWVVASIDEEFQLVEENVTGQYSSPKNGH